ncbi:MAG: molybdate ABC transporter substrate-binding protein [Syntrophomonadaceae bacterium]|nr:molybdate ABC transporter substrate-binding protein [Syntrophomonadaceae bacterium]
MMKNKKYWSIILIVMLIFSALCLVGCGKQDAGSKAQNGKQTETVQPLPYEGQELLVYSGAGISKAMDEMGQVFTKKYGAKVNFNYAGCAQLLSQMEINKQGDVFVGGSLNDIEIAKQKGFADQYVEVAYHIPAIAVPKGNPAAITGLADLGKPGIRLILGDEKANAIGKKGAKIFEKNNLTEAVEKNVVARAATVNEIVTKIGLKQGDAGLIFEDNGFEAKDIEVINIPPEQNAIDKVPVCVLRFTEKAELAQAFVDFTASAEGKAIFESHGFKVIE